MHITHSINQIYQWFYIANQPNLPSAFSKLKNDIFMLLTSNSILCRSNQLKILYWCNCHPSTEVQTPLLMPPRGLVFQYQHFIFWTREKPRMQTLCSVRFWFEKLEGWKGFDIAKKKFSLGVGHSSWLNGIGRDGVHDTLHYPWTPAFHRMKFWVNTYKQNIFLKKNYFLTTFLVPNIR